MPKSATDHDGPDRLRHQLADLPTFAKDVALLLGRVARDPRVPRSTKLLTFGAIAYVVSPIDLLPDFLPGVGQLDDVWLVSRMLRRLVRKAGYEVVREHWTGSDEGFARVLVLAGVEG